MFNNPCIEKLSVYMGIKLIFKIPTGFKIVNFR